MRDDSDVEQGEGHEGGQKYLDVGCILKVKLTALATSYIRRGEREKREEREREREKN